MKKFIVFIVTAIILAVSTSFTAKAQYAYPPQTTEQGQVVQQRISLLDMPDYKMAQEKARKGQTLFWAGLGSQVIGTALCCVPIMQSETYYDYGGYTQVNTTSSIGIACGVIGGLSAIAGSVMEIVGACKWINGAATMRDLRIAYSLLNGGIVVAF